MEQQLYALLIPARLLAGGSQAGIKDGNYTFMVSWHAVCVNANEATLNLNDEIATTMQNRPRRTSGAGSDSNLPTYLPLSTGDSNSPAAEEEADSRMDSIRDDRAWAAATAEARSPPAASPPANSQA